MIALASGIVEQQRTAVELAGMPDGWLRLGGLALLACLLYCVFWLYRREARAGASLRARMALATLRGGVLLALVAILLEPVVATYTKRITRSVVLLLVDDSSSIAIADEDDSQAPGATRREAILSLFTQDGQAWLRRLAERNRLAVYTFDEVGERLGGPAATMPEGAEAVPPSDVLRDALRADGGGTNPHAALELALADFGDGPIAAVVLVTDGQINAGPGADVLTQRMRGVRAQVFTVGVGGVEEPPNVRVSGVSAPASVALGDPLEVRVEVAASAIPLSTLEVELLAETTAPSHGASAEPRRVALQSVDLDPVSGQAELRVRVEPDAAGEWVYRARVAPMPREAALIDNEAGVSVLVQDQKLRVLLISGRPSFEYRFVSGLLLRDKTIELSTWLQSADATAIREGDAPIAELPRQPEQLLAYDAIVLLDPDPRELDSSWALTVRRLVDEFGGGLLYEAGPQYSVRFLSDPRLEELAQMLPVSPDPDAGVRLSEAGAFATDSMRLAAASDALDHPLLRLQDGVADSAAFWRSLPPLWWCYPVTREKSLATVLARATGESRGSAAPGTVALAIQPFGAGRVMFCGFDGTWRWRATAERAFDRFWVQTLRYLASARRQGMDSRGVLTLDRDRYRAGDSARIEARVLDPSFAPLHAERVIATLERADAPPREVELRRLPDREGWFSGRLDVDWTGLAVVRLPLPGQPLPGQPDALSRHVFVQRSDVEMRALRQNVELLEQLSAQTHGLYVPIAQAGELPDWIENADQVQTIRGADRSLWDRTWLLLGIAVALSIEWFLRRRMHLL